MPLFFSLSLFLPFQDDNSSVLAGGEWNKKEIGKNV
jgi:hypothetical protein